MRTKIFKDILSGIILATVIIITGLLIAVYLLGDKSKIDITLFIFGAVPIVIFLPALFTNARSGALHTPKVMYRKVDTLKRSEKQHTAEGKSSYSPLAFVIAGILTWLAGYVLTVM